MRAFADPVENELLSSYLGRCAQLRGTSMYRFLKTCCPDWQAWARDLDTCCTDAAVSQFARHTGAAAARIRAATLKDYVLRLKVSLRPDPGLTPFINAVGPLCCRTKRLFGLQFCPDCLAEHRAFMRDWRLSFMTVCETHDRLLADRCQRCGSPAMTGWGPNDVTRCWSCGSSLTAAGQRDVGDLGAYALATQRRLYRAIRGDAVRCGCVDLSADDFLQGSIALVRVLKGHARVMRSTSPWGEALCVGPRIELLNPAERSAWMALLGWLIVDWPTNFDRLADSARLTQVTFARAGALPEWLGRRVAALPAGRRHRKRSWTASLLREVRRIEENARAGYRAERSAVLLKAARSLGGH